MVAETPALIIWSKTFFIAAANATSVLTYIMFLQVKTQLISLPGKFPTSIVRCQRGLGGRSSVCLRRPTPSTLFLWIAIVKVMEQASACSTLHLVQLRVLAELMFLQSLLPDHNLYVFPPFILIILPLLKCILEQDSFCIHIPGLEAYTLLVGVVTVACCRWSPSGKKKQRWRFVFPLSTRSALILQETPVGSMGYSHCIYN